MTYPWIDLDFLSYTVLHEFNNIGPVLQYSSKVYLYEKLTIFT